MIDAIFLKVNGHLKIVPDAAIAAAQKKQVEAMFAGRPPRPLMDILREQGQLKPEDEATFKWYIEGKKELPADLPPEKEDSSLWMKAPHSLLEMSKPGPKDEVQSALESLEDALGPSNPDLQQLPLLDERQEMEMAQRAVRRGMIRHDQLRECLGKQLDDITKMRRKGVDVKTPEPKPKRSLLAILVERGFLNLAQIDDLLNEPTRHQMPPPPPGR